MVRSTPRKTPTTFDQRTASFITQPSFKADHKSYVISNSSKNNEQRPAKKSKVFSISKIAHESSLSSIIPIGYRHFSNLRKKNYINKSSNISLLKKKKNIPNLTKNAKKAKRKNRRNQFKKLIAQTNILKFDNHSNKKQMNEDSEKSFKKHEHPKNAMIQQTPVKKLKNKKQKSKEKNSIMNDFMQFETFFSDPEFNKNPMQFVSQMMEEKKNNQMLIDIKGKDVKRKRRNQRNSKRTEPQKKELRVKNDYSSLQKIFVNDKKSMVDSIRNSNSKSNRKVGKRRMRDKVKHNRLKATQLRKRMKSFSKSKMSTLQKLRQKRNRWRR